MSDADVRGRAATILERWRSALAVMFGGFLLWLAFPPTGLFWLAWVAPWPWLWLIGRPQLPGKRPHWQLFLGGFATWLLLIQWVRLPHWAAWFGWVAMALALATYFQLFVVAARSLVHRLGWPIWVAVPVAWTGVELVRGYLFTGFSMVLLGHAFYKWPLLLQVADLCGAYLVSFLVMATSACAFEAVHSFPRFRWRPAVLAVLILAGQTAYGWWRMGHEAGSVTASQNVAMIDVMLVQGAIDTTFDVSPNPSESRSIYAQLTRQALRQATSHPDLIIWPESMYAGFVDVAPDSTADAIPDDFNISLDELNRWCREEREALARFARELDTALILGCSTLYFGTDREHRYNSAICVARSGALSAHYRKMHPVMFGEYVPLGNWFPWLYDLTPMGAGLDAGESPASFEVEGVRLSPAICFENTVPQLIRSQVLELVAADQAPDALVTVTNDGWFWGSSLLDLHLACGVFRSVEHHLPMLIAANTGFSASIDSVGRVLEQGPRREEGTLRTQVSAWLPPRQGTIYQWWGDLPAAACAVVCLLGWLVAWRTRS